jgi:four helix bundle protein
VFTKLTTNHFPTYERYALTSQTRRAALSVPLNIVEGFARRHLAERLQFLRISWASLAELDYCLHVAKRLEYLTSFEHDELEADVHGTAAPLQGLIDQVAKRIRTTARHAR